jgi:dihydroflavonol-4-reductase
MYAVNARGTSALLAACAEAGVARIVHTSTIGTVGRPAGQGALPDESTPFELWEQASHYVRSKRLGELIAQAWNGAGVDVVIVKPAAPVGPGDGGADRAPTATGRRILALLQGRPNSYPPGGVNHAPVQDIAAGHLLAAERGLAGETYILGHCGGNLDRAMFLRLVQEGARANGLSLPHWTAEAKAGGALALTADPSRAVQELGMPQSDLAIAFAESVEWYKATFAQEVLAYGSAPDAFNG